MGFTRIIGTNNALGAERVVIESPAGAFGELSTITLRPQAQGDFVYGTVNTQTFTTASFIGSSVTAVSGICEVSSGTDANGKGLVKLRRGLKYRPGQGSMMRFTAIYDTPAVGNNQYGGVSNEECGYLIGYSGSAFGILHQQTSQLEIRRLDVTTAVNTNEIVTVTLNGESIQIPVTGSNSLTQTAYQLAQGDYTQIGGNSGGFQADVVSSSVFFISAKPTTEATGTYSVAGASIVGSFTRIKAGSLGQETFIPSNSFNLDRLDGLGPSGMVLDPQKGNVYQIEYQYLGFGNARFQIENPETGFFIPFHVVKNSNSRTTPVLKNPNVSAIVKSENTTGTTNKTIKTASMATFIEGDVIKLDPKFARSFAFASVTEADFTPLAVLKANKVFNDETCFGEFDILRLAASNTTVSSGKNLTVGFFLGAEIGGDVNFEYQDAEQSIVSYAVLTPDGVGKNTIDNLSEISPFYEIVLTSGNSNTENLDSLEFLFAGGQEMLIAIKGNNVDGDVSVNWFEQQ